jgi:hypothetical protein
MGAGKVAPAPLRAVLANAAVGAIKILAAIKCLSFIKRF